MPETFTSLDQYGYIRKGFNYLANSDHANLLGIVGVVNVTDIRKWSDGMIDVGLTQHRGNHSSIFYLTIDKLMRDDPISGKPIFQRV